MRNTIIQELRKNKPIKRHGLTAAKYSDIKTVLKSATGQVSGKTKLPTVRELTKIFHATTHPIQRAINELVRENILESKPRQGVYAKDQAGVQASPGERDNPCRELMKHLVFSSTVKTPEQRNFILNNFKKFSKQYRNIAISLNEREKHSKLLENYDIIEINSMTKFLKKYNLSNFMNLKPFLKKYYEPGDIEEDFVHCVPFQIHVPCLFWNETLLEKYKVTPECFIDFDSHLQFIDNILNRQGKLPLIVNAHQPVFWIGDTSQALIDLMKDKKGAIKIAEIKKRLKKVIEIFRVYFSVDTHQPASPLERFVSRQALVYYGFSYDIERLQNKKPDFKWAVFPFKGVDNKIPGFQDFLAVNNQTDYPVECARLLLSFLSSESQQKMPGISGMSVDSTARSMLAYIHIFFADHKKLLNEIVPFELKNHRHHYLTFNVINDEMWHGINNEINVDLVFDNIIELGHAYYELNNERQAI